MHCAALSGPRPLYQPPGPLTPESTPSDFGPASQQSPVIMEDLASHHSQPQHHPQPLPSPSTPSGNVLVPTWRGMVMSTIDALKIVEACLTGSLMHTARRPHDREREHLIRSGNVFVYEESSSGIKRWTDGQNWSPSRILGNYLIYRELDKNFPSGDKKRAIKRKRDGKPDLQQSGHPSTPGAPTSLNDERERALLGSLVDSYPFKEGGLIKKTISIKWNNVMHHLVSYYSLEDARNHRLPYPGDDPKLVHIRPRPELIQLQDFRVPIEQEDPRFLDDRALLLGMMPHAPYSQTPVLERTSSLSQIPQMTNNMLSNPYNTSQFHMGVPVHNSMGSGMQMGGHYGHPSTSFVSWEQQRQRAPALQLHTFASNLPHMIDSTGKRRRSDAYESTTPDGHEYFSPIADPTRTGQPYFAGATTPSSYSMPSLPAAAETAEYKPSGSNMGPSPSSTTTCELPPSSAAVAYAPVPMTSSMDFPSMTTATHPPPMTASTIDGPARGDQFFAPFNASSWGGGGGGNESNSYLPGPGRPLNGWHGAPGPGGHH